MRKPVFSVATLIFTVGTSVTSMMLLDHILFGVGNNIPVITGIFLFDILGLGFSRGSDISRYKRTLK